MKQPRRRQVLQASTGLALGTLGGCIDRLDHLGMDCPDDVPEDKESLTEWERSTPCDGIHDSVIRVEYVTTSLGTEYAPIDFADLSSEEKEILRTVTEEGGYATCDTSEAFDQFLRRVAEKEHYRQDPECVYLIRDCFYYGLRVHSLDQIYSGACNGDIL